MAVAGEVRSCAGSGEVLYTIKLGKKSKDFERQS